MVKENRWMDGLSLVFSLILVSVTALWMLQRQVFDITLTNQENWSWYMVRSTGVTAYILMTIALLWGIAVSSRVVKDWSPGMLSMLLHGSISWLAVAFGLIHAVFLLWDRYFTYHLWDLLIPFVGPYKPFAVGLGTVAFWLGCLIALSFGFKKQLGNTTWQRLHYTSYGLFFLVTAHALLAGTDAQNFGVQVMFGLGAMSVVLMLGYRLGKR